MKRQEIISSLKQIQGIVGRCLDALEQDQSGSDTSSSSEAEAATDSTPGQSLTDSILRARDAGFFKVPRTAREAHEAIGVEYPCELDRVVTALLRLNNRKKLRRASKVIDARKQVAYVW